MTSPKYGQMRRDLLDMWVESCQHDHEYCAAVIADLLDQTPTKYIKSVWHEHFDGMEKTMSPNYTSLIDDATELADRFYHAHYEASAGSVERKLLSASFYHMTSTLEQVRKAKEANAQHHTDGIIARVTHGKATKADTQHIRKALENFYD